MGPVPSTRPAPSFLLYRLASFRTGRTCSTRPSRISPRRMSSKWAASKKSSTPSRKRSGRMDLAQTKILSSTSLWRIVKIREGARSFSPSIRAMSQLTKSLKRLLPRNLRCLRQRSPLSLLSPSYLNCQMKTERRHRALCSPSMRRPTLLSKLFTSKHLPGRLILPLRWRYIPKKEHTMASSQTHHRGTRYMKVLSWALARMPWSS
mmetsp:Transcript_5512/g.9372  ORF Transcript_5512/g.9372 Transcript_5512/m.9372 type:complete len:206 (-) Transcript_5512:467-1084(-)